MDIFNDDSNQSVMRNLGTHLIKDKQAAKQRDETRAAREVVCLIADIKTLCPLQDIFRFVNT